MFRSRRKHVAPIAAASLLLGFGAFALMSALARDGLSSLIAAYRDAMLAVLTVGAASIALASIARMRATRRFDEIVGRVIEHHIDALVLRNCQLRGSETSSGELSRWAQEIAHFIATQIAPLLSAREERVLRERHLEVFDRLENRVAIAAASRARAHGPSESGAPRS